MLPAARAVGGDSVDELGHDQEQTTERHRHRSCSADKRREPDPGRGRAEAGEGQAGQQQGPPGDRSGATACKSQAP